MTLMEAMAAGLPHVTSLIRGNTDLLNDLMLKVKEDCNV